MALTRPVSGMSTLLGGGQRRVASFRVNPQEEVRLPEPSIADKLRVTGMSGFKGHRQAVINKRTFEVGDEQEVQVGNTTIKVRCVEIRDGSVIVSVAGARPQAISLRHQ